MTIVVQKETGVELKVWKTLKGGALSKAELRKELSAVRHLMMTDQAEKMLRWMSPLDKEQDLDLVILAGRDLNLMRAEVGFRGVISPYTYGDIYRVTRKFGLRLCPAEVGPLLRINYIDQPDGEFVKIAMLPFVEGYHINDPGEGQFPVGRLESIFNVFSYGGRLWLGGTPRHCTDHHWVFWKPRK